MKLILASKSPRRKEILENFGFDIEIDTVDIEEISDEERLLDQIVDIARKKTEAVADLHPADYVVGADTMVVLDGYPMGKPKDIEDAKGMLRSLSGRNHRVITAYALINRGKGIDITDYEMTEISFVPLSEEDIEWYVSTGEPMDKAGAYGIQGKGAIFIERMDGDFFSTMGFPLGKFVRSLKKLGINIL